MLDRLPDTCSIDDVFNTYVVQAVSRGDADVADGRTALHAQVEAELRRKWLRHCTVVWLNLAQAALDEVVVLYMLRTPATRPYQVLAPALETAATLTRGLKADRGRMSRNYRTRPVESGFRYRLMYRVFPEQVHIVAFLHGARDFAIWQSPSTA